MINGLNSGYAAINLAVLKKARRIYLLGFDMVPTAKDKTHWHDGYPWNNGSSIVYYSRWAKLFDTIAKQLPDGVEVINANENSGIDSFKKTTYRGIGL